MLQGVWLWPARHWAKLAQEPLQVAISGALQLCVSTQDRCQEAGFPIPVPTHMYSEQG
jgi:hypothetical protein